MVRLVVQEPADAGVVARAPEQEDHGKDGDPDARGKEVPHGEQVEQDGYDGDVRGVLWLRWVEQLRHHVLGMRHGEDYKRRRISSVGVSERKGVGELVSSRFASFLPGYS